MSSTNYSSFWMDNDWDNRRTSIFDEDEIIERPKVDVVALAAKLRKSYEEIYRELREIIYPKSKGLRKK